MKSASFIVLFVIISMNLTAQKYMTQTGSIRFFSKAPLENIEAVNNQVSSVIDMNSGEIVFRMLMKAFVFEKALMQEHFNDKYVESHKFPRASFRGKIINFEKIEVRDKPVNVQITGTLAIKDISKEIEASGTLQRVQGGNISGKSEFTINLKEFGIRIPSAVRNNISDNILITVKMEYEKLD